MGKALKHERLQALMGDGGNQECGFASARQGHRGQGREVMKQAIKDFFRS